MRKFNPKSISFRLVIGGCLAVILPLIVVGYLAITKSSEALVAISKDNALVQAKRVASAVEASLAFQERFVGTIASDEVIRDLAQTIKTKEAANAVEEIAKLREVMKRKSALLGETYDGVFVADHKGLYVAGAKSNGDDMKSMNLADRKYFQDVQSSGKTVVSDLVRSKDANLLVYVACAPIKGSGGEFLGAVVLGIKGNTLVDMVLQAKTGRSGYAFMADKKGIINAHPDEKLILTLDLTTLKGMEEISKAMTGRSGLRRQTT